MDKIEYRAVIKFLFLQGKARKAIRDEMFLVYQDNCPSYDVVKHWCKQFKCGRLSIQDGERDGRPSTARNDDIIKKVQDLILNNRRVTINDIVNETGVSHGSVCNIVHNELHMSKVSARWVPRLLTPIQMQNRQESSVELLTMCNAGEDDFFSCLVTVDESWIHHFDPESKLASKQWKHVESPPPKKAKCFQSAGKVMLTVFWDERGVILTDYLPRGQTITGKYYSSLLTRLREKIKAKRRGMIGKGVLLLQDNAPAHNSVVAQQTARACGFQILPHPAYSPDLAPSDFFLFPALKSDLRGRHFPKDDDVISATEDWFSSKMGSFYKDGIRKVKKRWEKCVTVGGSYVEKD